MFQIGDRVLIAPNRVFGRDNTCAYLTWVISELSQGVAIVVNGTRRERVHTNYLVELTPREDFIICHDCMVEKDPRSFCPSCGYCAQCCVDSSSSNCASCDTVYCHQNRTAICDNCDSCFADCCICNNHDYDDSYEDERVNRSREHIQDYMTDVVRVTGHMVPDSVRTYGIEIEVCAKNQNDYDEILYLINSTNLRHTWVPKRDGSLPTYGIEIVSVPLSLTDLSEEIRKLFQTTNLEKHIVRSSQCGTHVHVGRSSVDRRTISRVWYPWAFASRDYSAQDGKTIAARRGINDNRAQLTKILKALAGRDPNGYCAWDSTRPVSWKESRNDRSDSYCDHYAAVSRSSHYDTYELRMFAGVTKQRSALRFLQTADMLLSIASETDGTQVLRDSSQFLKAIGERIARYPDLHATARLQSSRLAAFYDDIRANESTPKKRLNYVRPNIDLAAGASYVRPAQGMRYLSRIEANAKAKVLA